MKILKLKPEAKQKDKTIKEKKYAPQFIENRYHTLKVGCTVLGIILTVASIAIGYPTLFFLAIFLCIGAPVYYYFDCVRPAMSDSITVIEGIVFIPKGEENQENVKKRLSDSKMLTGVKNDFKRTYVHIKSNDNMYYSIPASPKDAMIPNGTMVKAYVDKSMFRYRSENDILTEHAFAFEILRANLEEE